MRLQERAVWSGQRHYCIWWTIFFLCSRWLDTFQTDLIECMGMFYNIIRSLSVLTFTAFHWRKPFPTINSPTLFCLSLEESIDGFVRSVANCQNHLLRKQNMVIIQYKSRAEQEFYSMCVNTTENKLSDL